MTTSKPKSSPSKNAISHGAFTREIVLPWEDEQEFRDLHRSLQEELFPDGVSEEEVVFSLACLHWKRRRLNFGSQLLYRRIPDAAALADAGRNGWDGIADYINSSVQDAETVRGSIRDFAKGHAAAQTGFFELLNKQLAVMRASEVGSGGTPAPTETPDSNETSSTTGSPTATNQGMKLSNDQLDWLQFFAKEMTIYSKVIPSALRAIENYNPDETLCERAYRPEILERELKIHAEIDKRIEKTMQRLVVIKEYKKLYQPKEVKGPAAVATIPLAKKPSS